MPGRRKTTAQRGLEFVFAIIVGNAIYFALQPWLPAVLRHEIFRLDLGLALDFLLCVGIYLLARRWFFAR